MTKIKQVINDPKMILKKIIKLLSPFIEDISYLKIIFLLNTGYKLDLINPKTYNQKLQWLKLNFKQPIMNKMVDKYEAKKIVADLIFKQPIMNKMVDKYEAKKIVADLIGEKYVIKNYGIWDSFEQIDFGTLPTQFVLKTTHDQGGVVICNDKASFNYNFARSKITKHLNAKHFLLSREWPYKDVKPRIIAEEYISSSLDIELKDYKFFCFNGKVKAMFIASDRQSGSEVKFDFYDKEFNSLDIIQIHPQSGKNISKPKNFEIMIELAEKLSMNLPHIRIDLYNKDGEIFFGEFTFFHHGGLVPFHPNKWDYIFGNWIDIEQIRNQLIN